MARKARVQFAGAVYHVLDRGDRRAERGRRADAERGRGRGERVNAGVNADRWEYGYNGRGEVNGGSKLLADGSTAFGVGFSYTFDAIGNRKNANRENTIGETFTRNERNQYTLITRGVHDGPVVGGRSRPARR